MARPAKQPARQLNPGQASYVIERLMKDRRVSASEINVYLGEMQKEIADLEQRLQSLRAAAGSASGAAAAGGAAASQGAPARRRRRGRTAGAAPAQGAAAAPAKRRRSRKSTKSNAEVMASRQLQGRYLALVRQIPQNKRAQFSRLAKEKSREAAIKEMTDFLKK